MSTFLVLLLLIGGIALLGWAGSRQAGAESHAQEKATPPVTPNFGVPFAVPRQGPDDTEENYRQHLTQLISRTKSRGNTRYYNKFVNRCRDEAALAFPKGAEAARKKDMAAGGALGALAVLFSFFG